MDETLQAIRDFADRSHGTQMRKYENARYIVHPERVMQLCAPFTNERAMLAAALLHDVLEDTPVTQVAMLEFLKTVMPGEEAQRTLNLVVELTDVYVKKTYPQWNRKRRKEAEQQRMATTSADAQTVKYADIIDNCRHIASHDPQFARVFMRECRQLMQVMDKGNETLRAEAMRMLKM